MRERAMRVVRPAAMKNRGPDLKVLFVLSFKACISSSISSTSTTPRRGPRLAGHKYIVFRFEALDRYHSFFSFSRRSCHNSANPVAIDPVPSQIDAACQPWTQNIEALSSLIGTDAAKKAVLF